MFSLTLASPAFMSLMAFFIKYILDNPTHMFLVLFFNLPGCGTCTCESHEVSLLSMFYGGGQLRRQAK